MLLHGRGSDEHDLVPLIDQLDPDVWRPRDLSLGKPPRQLEAHSDLVDQLLRASMHDSERVARIDVLVVVHIYFGDVAGNSRADRIQMNIRLGVVDGRP